MDFKDLKVGDMVFIREDLEDDKLYGNNVYIDDMCKGIQEIGFVSRENGIIRTVETPDYSYTPEMIDWEKTKKIRNIDFKEIIQCGECRKEITKATTYDGREITVKNSNEENDIEKAVMMLMLKARGVTYGDVKKEVEKVKVKWMPQLNKKYYYISEYLMTEWSNWFGMNRDNNRLKNGNCFETRKEAEEKLKKIKEVLKGE